MRIRTKRLLEMLKRAGLSVGYLETALGEFFIERQQELCLDEKQAEVMLKLFSVQEVLQMMKGNLRPLIPLGGQIYAVRY